MAKFIAYAVVASLVPCTVLARQEHQHGGSEKLDGITRQEDMHVVPSLKRRCCNEERQRRPGRILRTTGDVNEKARHGNPFLMQNGRRGPRDHSTRFSENSALETQPCQPEPIDSAIRVNSNGTPTA